jgi:hypothetical protein
VEEQYELENLERHSNDGLDELESQNNNQGYPEDHEEHDIDLGKRDSSEVDQDMDEEKPNKKLKVASDDSDGHHD